MEKTRSPEFFGSLYAIVCALRALESQSTVSNTSLWSKNLLLLFLNTTINEAILTIVDTQNPDKFNTRWFMRLSTSCKSYSESLYRKKTWMLPLMRSCSSSKWVAHKNVPNSNDYGSRNKTRFSMLIGNYIATCSFAYTPFTRYNRLYNRLDNRGFRIT